MKNFNEIHYTAEGDEINALLANWLKMYTGAAIKRVAPRINEIINDEMTMMLLRELKKREDEERIDFARDLEWIMCKASKDEPEEIDSSCEIIHNHCLTHSEAYRNVLYDMYINR